MTGGADRAQVLASLRGGESFAFLLHVRPDGDSIGSSLALGLALIRLGKRVVLVRADEIPANMRFLPGSDRFMPWESVEGSFDFAVLLDCGDLGRVGAARALLDRVRGIINIDHHLSNARFGHVNYIEPTAAAAGEIAYDLIEGLGVEMDYDMAVALYASIVTDTGSFRYDNTSPQTHAIARDLLQRGVRPGEVAQHIWEGKSLAYARLLATALGSLQVSADGRLAWIDLPRQAFEGAGATVAESEGFINYPRIIAGVEVAALFVEDGSGEIKISLRSNRWVDVSRVAASLGGGGHARASGCVLKCGLDEAKRRVLDRLQQALEEDPGDARGT